MNWKKTLLISLIILLAGAGITVLIFMTEPTAQRGGATKETAMLVGVTRAERGNFRPTIVATGTVQAAEDIMLSPRVSGEVLRRSPAFVPGGYVREGQVLLQLDPADYQNALQLRQSDLLQAEADLALEMGQQDVARQDYQLIGDSLSENNEALVLRQPQLKAARARLKAAEASVEQAKLQVERTTIRAPFDAHILTRNVNVGSQVAPGDVLSRMVGVEEYWVVANVPLSHLRWLSFPGQGQGRGSEVQIRNRTAWPEGEYRRGYLYKLMGALEDQTRLARVMVTVPNPLGYGNDSLPALIIGAFVETRIMGKKMEDVVRLNRDYLREDDTVWIMKEGKLRIQEVDIAFRDAKYAYISSGLTEEDQIVTTNLSTVTDGAPLRLAEDEDSSSQDTIPDTAQQIDNGQNQSR